MTTILSINMHHDYLEGTRFSNIRNIAKKVAKKVLMSLIFLIDKKLGLKIKNMGIIKNISMHEFSIILMIYGVSEGRVC